MLGLGLTRRAPRSQIVLAQQAVVHMSECDEPVPRNGRHTRPTLWGAIEMPCTPPPQTGVPSTDTLEAMPNTERRILVLKTGYSETLDRHDAGRIVSLGDILRTTPLLHVFRHDHVTWVTDESAMPLLNGIEEIDRLIGFTSESANTLGSEQFDVVINLEKDPELCTLAESVQAGHRCGFMASADSDGGEEPSGGIARACRDLGARQRNRKPLQQLLFETIEADWAGEEYILGHDAAVTNDYDVALNTDVGRKWPTKKWPSWCWDDLESMLSDAGYTVTRQDKQSPHVYTRVMHYIEWLDCASLVVTADTLGLHVTLALKKPVVAMFGPTPCHEVHLYGRGVALLPDPWPQCAPCMSPHCQAERHCMEDIRPDVVFRQVERTLHASQTPSLPTH